MRIRARLLTWYKRHGRHDLPWRQTREPYRILVSELMLQQTQVSRVIPKYRTFLAAFPTIKRLAAASRREVLLHWQGLGYNTRAVRLHTLAKLIVEEYNGRIPDTREGLLSLPGIGPYTAGAIMIFAHEVPAESVDTNVRRIIRRLFWDRTETPAGVVEREQQLLGRNPHDVQSALMDLGSVHCTSTPVCHSCPLRKFCKSQGRRPDETKKSQGPFKGSNRWLRGRILQAVLERKTAVRELRQRFEASDEEFRRALEELAAEGLLTIENATVRAG